MINYFYSLPVFQQVLLAVAALVGLCDLIYYLFLIIALGVRSRRKILGIDAPKPTIAVILRTGYDRSELAERVLPFLHQSYPDYVLVVVDDSGEDDGTPMLTPLKEKYPHLHVASAPSDGKFTSVAKLSLTVGIRATDAEWIVQVDRHCPPSSEEWLLKLSQQFTPETGVVIGYNRLRSAGTFPSAIAVAQHRWHSLLRLAYAKTGGPYLGDRANLAYRRELFLAHQGFMGVNHFTGGEGTLLASRLATKKNVQVATSRVAQTEGVAFSSWREYYRHRVAEYQARRHLPVATRFKLSLDAILRSATWIVSLILMLQGGELIFVGLGLLLLRRLLHLVSASGAMFTYKERWNLLSLWLYDLSSPLLTLRVVRKYRVFKRQPLWR